MATDRAPLTPIEERIDRWAGARAEAAGAGGGARRRGAVELTAFGLKQAWACVVGAIMLVLIVAARTLYPDGAGLARSDLLVLAAVAVQVAMIVLRLESLRELGVILVFHVVGTVMEVFKTAAGSWGRTKTRRPLRPSANSTRPLTVAKIVWSRPSPVPSPGRNRVPRWRTMIEPAGTTCPAKTFTPRNFGFESRPLRLEPPPFL